MATQDPHESLARLLAEHHRRIFGFIRTLVPNRVDADDLFQETCVVIWKEFTNFRSGSDFAPWALGIAFNRVRTFRHQVRRSRLTFSEGLMEKLAEEERARAPEQSARSRALESCLGRLSPKDHELITRYYASQAAVPELATLLDRPINTIYKALQRIRRALHECIQRSTAAESAP